jgi:hypothetical protein
MNPRIKKVRPIANFILELEFINGEIKLFDLKPYLNTGKFSELKSPEIFNSVKPFLGSIQWSNGLDLCPDTLYENSTSLNL